MIVGSFLIFLIQEPKEMSKMDIFKRKKQITKINNIMSMSLEITCSCGREYIVTEKEGGTRCPKCKKDVEIGVTIM